MFDFFRRRDPGSPVFAVVLTIIFSAIAICNVLHHPMWRDEIRVWQICAASPSIQALRENLHYEAVPLLWYLIIWIVTRCTRDMVWMQITHVLVASGVILVFAWRSPFTSWIKILFTFSYFPFFEYATISRSYGLLFLLLLASVSILTRSTPLPFLLALILVLLSQVSIWGAGIAGLMSIVAVIHWMVPPGKTRVVPIWKALAAMGIVLAGCIACFLQALPGPGSSTLFSWGDTPVATRAMLTCGTIWDGWVPLPKWTPDFWNSNLLDDHSTLRCWASIVLLALAVLCLLRRPVALLLLLCGLVGIMGFTYFKFLGETRHHGHLFMILITACWLARHSTDWTPPVRWLSALSESLSGVCQLLLGALLVAQVLSGVGANVAGWFIPFTASKEIAEYIRHDLSPDLHLVGIEDYCMPSIGAYLGREIYMPQIRRSAPFTTLADSGRYRVSLDSIFDDFRTLTMQDGHDVVFLLSSGRSLGGDDFNAQIPAGLFAPAMAFHVTLLRKFTRSSVADESETLYLVHRIN